MLLKLTVLRSAHMWGLAPATSQAPEEFTRRDWSTGLGDFFHAWTVYRKRFEEQVTETWPKNSNWFEFVGLRRLDFEAEMASSYDGVCPRDLLRRRNTRYKNPQLVARHCFVASFRWCFPFFTLRDQLDPQQKHLLRVEEMRRADWLIC